MTRNFGIMRLTGVAVLVLGAALQPASAKQTRSYAVTWFGQAAASREGDCAAGLNPKMDAQYAKDIQALGYNGTQTEELMKTYIGEGSGDWGKDVVRQMMNSRARIGGKEANTYAHPAAVSDPHLHSVTGKVAYGFNLDGKGADDAAAFEDPDTHEKGIDNQLFRALGCVDSFRGNLEVGTAFWLFMWMAEKDSIPAWLISISGDDLDKDGPVEVRFTRAFEIVRYNADGSPRADMTYREDPDPRTAGNVFKGEVKGGVLNLTEAKSLHMMQDQLTFPQFDLENFHLRMTTKADGTVEGVLGGYQSIEQVYFALAQGGMASESAFGAELPGMYWNLRKFADAAPDKSGQNWSISTTWYLRAVPAFVAHTTQTAVHH